MKTSTQFSLLIFAPLLLGLLLQACFLLPSGVLVTLLAVFDPSVSSTGTLSYWTWVIGPMLAACGIYLTGLGLYRLYRLEGSPWIAWIAIWVFFTVALFLTGWFGITIITSIGASDKPVAIFLSWTALMAAGLATLAQPLVLLWLYAVSRAVRRLQSGQDLGNRAKKLAWRLPMFDGIGAAGDSSKPDLTE